MKAFERIALLVVALACFVAASCGAGGGDYYVGYGYSRSTYDEVFYQSPMDRSYGYGFYGHP